jgi:hypothetical protein
VHIDTDPGAGDASTYRRSGWTVAIGMDFTEDGTRMLAGRSDRGGVRAGGADRRPPDPRAETLNGRR